MSFFAMGQTTDFSYRSASGLYCLPADIQFTQTSSGTPVGYLWDFGNGTRSNRANPVATYTAPGTYTVRLITVYENTTAQKSKNIVIHPSITTTFNTDRNYICEPGTINFTASNTGTLQNYIWDFGDSSPLVTGTANTISHNYSNFGDFTITLKATSTTGCFDIFSRTIKVKKPVISGSVSEHTGCVPKSTDFRATVTLPPGSTVSSYLWDFGDENTNTTSTGRNSHNYINTGSFSPKVTITTVEGCTASYVFDSLFFGIPPTNQIAYPVDTVLCGSETPQFVSTATNATSYEWNFGGGINSVSDTLTEHRFTALGVKNISVTPIFNGCPGTTDSFHIEIIGVIAKFTYANTCNDKKTFSFNNTSQGNMSSINWNLGDHAYPTTPGRVTHTYPGSGEFAIKLLISDNITGCVDSFKRKIYTANPVLSNNDSSICLNTNTRFTIKNNYRNPAATYKWDVLGTEIGPDVNPALTLNANTLGYFNNNLVIINNGSQYCPDTIRLNHPITIRGPQLDFNAPTNICLNTALNVVNLSHPFQPADSIKLWYWNFGRVAQNDTIYQPSPYNYINPKAYNVKLTAVDKYGCKDSLVKVVNVRPMPFLWIIPKLDTLCAGLESSTLIGYTSDEILWSPAQTGFCLTCDTTTVRPAETTRYYATATNSFNCTATDSALVKVFKPFTAVPLTPNQSICAGGKVQLDMDPKMKKIIWTPAESLSNAAIYKPIASPGQTTSYLATLTDSAGCFISKASINITVNPKPDINAGPDKIYPYNTAFSLAPNYSPNVIAYLWTPSDSLSCSTCPRPSAIATTTKKYTITATSDSGCIASDNITIFVECLGANLLMPKAFTPNNDNLNDLYRPISRGFKTITRFSIYNRQGQLVYENRDFSPNKTSAGWNGKFRGQDQENAAYVYIVEAICDLGQTIVTKGSFVLIR